MFLCNDNILNDLQKTEKKEEKENETNEQDEKIKLIKKIQEMDNNFVKKQESLKNKFKTMMDEMDEQQAMMTELMNDAKDEEKTNDQDTTTN